MVCFGFILGMLNKRTVVRQKIMLVGYVRVSKSDGSQNVDLQVDALQKAGVSSDRIYQDHCSGKLADRKGLDACLKSLRENDVLVIWKLDRLGRSLQNLISIVKNLEERKVGLKVLTGKGENIDTTTPMGKLLFGFFSALSEFERDLIVERTKAGLASARARGRKGGRKFALSKAQVRLAQVAMANKETLVNELCKELGITRATLYRYVDSAGNLRSYGKQVLGIKENEASTV